MRPMPSLTKKPTIQCSTLTYVSQANKVKIINHSQCPWAEIGRQM